METVIRDVRYAVRVFTRQRGFAVMAITTIALAVGLATALFSVIDAAMLHPLPYPNPEQLVRVSAEIGGSRPTPSMADMRLWESADQVFSAVTGWGGSFGGRIADGPEPERVQVTQVTEGYFSVYGVQPLFGRAFTREDMDTGAPNVALLGYTYWKNRYGGRTDVLGDTVRLDDGVASIVGVMPESFNRTTPVFRPLRVPAAEVNRRGTGRVSVMARLRPDMTLEQAAERLAALMGGTPGTRVVLTSELESTVRGFRTTVQVLTGAVILIVLIACVNVGGLLLARGEARQSELAIRASLGAGRARLVRQLLTESIVLASVGGFCGVALAWLSLSAIVANIPLSLPVNAPPAINVSVLVASTLLLLTTALLFGLMPAMRLSRVRIGSALARNARQSGSSLSRRGSRLLIASEVALAVVLVSGAALMIRSFSKLTAADLGLNRGGLMTMEVLPLERNVDVHAAYYPALLQQIRLIPGVQSAGLVDNFALGGRTSFSSVKAGTTTLPASVFRILPGYFEALGARLREGHLPTEAELASGQRLVVLDQPAARTLFPDGAAIGREITGQGKSQTAWRVSAVIDSLRHGGPIDTRGTQQVFFSYEPNPSDLAQAMVVIVRPSGTIPDLANRLRSTAQSIGPRVLVERIRSADDWFGSLVITPRRRTVLLGLLGSLGLILVLVGIFGMTAYTVARRTAEVGVRMAFGARPVDVVRQIVGESVAPLLIGLAVGLVGAFYASRLIESFLFQTTPHDPLTFVAVAILMTATALLAAWIPARRAARIDPIIALRSE